MHLPIIIPHVKQIYINTNSVEFSMTVAIELSSIIPVLSECITSVPDKEMSSNKSSNATPNGELFFFKSR